MKCKICGFKNELDSQFCEKCGAGIDVCDIKHTDSKIPKSSIIAYTIMGILLFFLILYWFIWWIS